jgi:hypothetical protein
MGKRRVGPAPEPFERMPASDTGVCCLEPLLSVVRTGEELTRFSIRHALQLNGYYFETVGRYSAAASRGTSQAPPGEFSPAGPLLGTPKRCRPAQMGTRRAGRHCAVKRL